MKRPIATAILCILMSITAFGQSEFSDIHYCGPNDINLNSHVDTCVDYHWYLNGDLVNIGGDFNSTGLSGDLELMVVNKNVVTNQTIGYSIADQVNPDDHQNENFDPNDYLTKFDVHVPIKLQSAEVQVYRSNNAGCSSGIQVNLKAPGGATIKSIPIDICGSGLLTQTVNFNEDLDPGLGYTVVITSSVMNWGEPKIVTFNGADYLNNGFLDYNFVQINGDETTDNYGGLYSWKVEVPEYKQIRIIDDCKESYCPNKGASMLDFDFGSPVIGEKNLTGATSELDFSTFGTDLPGDDQYTIASAIGANDGKDEWFNINNDHTANDALGGMMIVNAFTKGKEIIRLQLDDICKNNYFNVDFSILNINSANFAAIECGSVDDVVSVNLIAKVVDGNGNTLGEFETGDIDAEWLPSWKEFEFSFLPTESTTSDVYLVIINNAEEGCGNDFALDDISLSPCLDGVEVESLTTICEDRDLTIQAKVSLNHPDVQFQWQHNNSGSWNDLPNETEKELVVVQPNLYNNDQYRLAYGIGEVSNDQRCRLYTNPLTISTSPCNGCQPPLAVEIFGPDSMNQCLADDYEIRSTLISGYNYEWFNNGSSFSNDLSNNAIELNKMSGWFKVKVSDPDFIDEAGCYKEDSVFVQGRNGIELPNDTVVCGAFDINLKATEKFCSYLWNDGSTDNSTDANIGWNWVEVTLNGCTTRDSVLIAQKELPVDDLISDTTVCAGNEIVLSAEALKAYPEFNFEWNDGSKDELRTINLNSNSTFILFVTDGNCDYSDTADITISHSIVFNFDENVSVCDNATLTLNGPEEGTKIWSTGSTSNSILVSENDLYSLTTYNDEQCTHSDSINVSFSTIPASANIDTVICFLDGEASIGVKPNNNHEYEWSNMVANSSIEITESGDYTLTISEGDCTSKQTYNVSEYCDYQISVPSAFSPNNDGLNDYFPSIQTPLIEIHIQIFDRWGSLIFESYSADENWDGAIDNRLVPDDSYVYKIQYSIETKSGLVKKDSKIGTVSIVK